MITRLKGRLVEKSPTEVVVDCNGVGYLVHISLHTYAQLSNEENICLLTHLLVREDSHTLYGFFDEIERATFRLLISVSGIGANTARTMLSSLSPFEIQKAIMSEEVTTIQSVKGIGLKTAQRVIIDLKDKIAILSGMEEVSASLNNTTSEEALSALEVLGFSRKQSQKVIDNLLKTTPDMTVESLIKNALNKL